MQKQPKKQAQVKKCADEPIGTIIDTIKQFIAEYRITSRKYIETANKLEQLLRSDKINEAYSMLEEFHKQDVGSLSDDELLEIQEEVKKINSKKAQVKEPPETDTPEELAEHADPKEHEEHEKLESPKEEAAEADPNANNPKVQALMQFLGLKDPSEVSESTYSDDTFEAAGGEFRVLTDEEADAAVRADIEENVWAFRSEFLAAHIDDMEEEDIRAMSEKMYERANPIFKKLIRDFDHFCDDAVLSDGRGHFLSPVNGEENEESVNGIWYYIYQVQ